MKQKSNFWTFLTFINFFIMLLSDIICNPIDSKGIFS